MAIQECRGLKADLDTNKLLPAQMAVPLDTQEVYMCFSPGVTKRMASKEDLQAILDSSPTAYSALQQLIADLGNQTTLTSLLNTQTEVNNARGAFTDVKSRLDDSDSRLTQILKVGTEYPTEPTANQIFYKIV